ncbi:unnamed protein product, partial [Rotaria sp. Silwood2]
MYAILFKSIFLLTVLDLSRAAHKRYEWTLRYATYNPDGVYRRVISIDNSSDVFKFPGPTIRAQKNDIIEVIVHNELPTEVTSIHWHGIHQLNTPWMDGVSYTTQYPILPLHSFNYTFVASPVGTHWYHSHTGAQYSDGLFGSLIVEDPNDPYKQFPELSLIMNEWYHRYAIDIFDILSIPPTTHHHRFPEFISGLMNGKDNHELTVIAIDGVYVEPYNTQQLWIYIGQRYDFLVTMNQQSPLGVYWIRAVTAVNDTNQFHAILHYNNTRNGTPEPPTSPLPRNLTGLVNSMPLVPSKVNTDFSLQPPTFNETLIVHIICVPSVHRCTVNSHSYKMPREPTLFTLYKHGIQQPPPLSVFNLRQNAHVMIVVTNFQNFGHPFHLHGHSFYVLGMGKQNQSGTGEPYIFDPVRDRHTLNFINPPYRDTEQVPELSYIVIGFIANNPGSWLFHCHFAWHAEAGMVAVFNVVGGRIPPPPPNYSLLINYRDQINLSGK